jgi:hypothetical protein
MAVMTLASHCRNSRLPDTRHSRVGISLVTAFLSKELETKLWEMRLSRRVVSASSLKISTGRISSNLIDLSKNSSRDQEWLRDSRIHLMRGEHIWAIAQSRVLPNNSTSSTSVRVLDSSQMQMLRERMAWSIKQLTIHSSRWGKTFPRVLPARTRTKEALHLPSRIKKYSQGTKW